jgi:signal transduction histidine kinase
MGLEPALRSYVEGFSRRSNIEVSLDVSRLSARYPAEIELALFRVVQEGLGNIHRHSSSRTASIRLREHDHEIILEVTDSGKGIPAEIIQSLEHGLVSSGVGLAAMQERMREVGGQLVIEHANPGTRLRAVLPIPKETT